MNKLMEEEKLQQEQQEKPNVLFEFSFPSYEKHRRGTRWYVVAIIVASAFIIYALITANFLFAVLVVIISFIIFLHDLREPTQHSCFLTEAGVCIDDDFHPYSSFEGFWMVFEPPRIKNLYLDFNGILRSYISIPLGDADPVEVRRWMRRVVMENLEHNDEPFGEQIGRLFKI